MTTLQEPDSLKLCQASPITIGFISVLCLWYSVGMRALPAQSTRGLSSDTTLAPSPRPAAESDTLLRDILQERVALAAASTVTGSTLSQHEERPFRRKPRKNVLVDASLAVPITALLVVAVVLGAWIKRRHVLHGAALGSVTAFDPGKSLRIESISTDTQIDTASEEAREESCQPR